MKKLLKALALTLAVLLAAGCAVLAPHIRGGWTMYRQALEEKSVAQAAEEVREKDGYLPLSDISEDFLAKVIRSEDKRFYRHPGFDLLAIARALFNDLRAGSPVEGGSTITQQLAKNLYFSFEKKLDRKFAEIFMSRALERALTKDEILELYCNVAYFGEGCYGVGDAAEHYYAVDAAALSGEQSDALVLTLRCPSCWNPNALEDAA